MTAVVITDFATEPDSLAAQGILGINFGNSRTPEVLTTLADTGKLRVHIDAEVPLGQARGKTVIML
jgi:hypothetical protein